MSDFKKTVTEIRHGALSGELNEKFAEVIRAVRETGKPGKFTLELVVRPAGKSTSALLVEDRIKTTVPEVTKEQTVFFADESGKLTRNDPRQPVLDGLRVIDVPRPREGAANE